MSSLSRRDLIGVAAIAATIPAIAAIDRAFGSFGSANAATTEKFAVNFTPAQWRQRLAPAAFAVLREEGTERPFTSPLNDEHRAGVFACAGCALPAYKSQTKFDSGTGWPSFYAPIANAVSQRTDGSFGMSRTEIHCRRCGGHLGHVFNDGPQPTGLRYCMNGVALSFTPTHA